jgi:hypothetical protein
MYDLHRNEYMERKFHRENKTIELIETQCELENFLLWNFSSIYSILEKWP